MKPVLLHVVDYNNNPVLIPLDNVAFISEVEGVTRIYLRMVATVEKDTFIMTKEPLASFMRRLSEIPA